MSVKGDFLSRMSKKETIIFFQTERNIMKNVEKLAIVVIVLMVISTLFQPLQSFFIARLYGVEGMRQISSSGHSMVVINVILRWSVQIGVGIWLFILARQEKATPWVWLLLSLCFGLLAPILFFIVRIYEKGKENEI